MKRKIVLWGTNEKDEKILVALQLMDKDGKVNIYTFNEELATEDLYNKLLNQWREGATVEFPDGHTVIERPLNMTDTILPDSIKVDRTDIISRAQTEWHFVVLSSKLYEMYKSELEDIQEKVEGLIDFDNKVWNEMKTFWSKVQEQVIEKNLFREHASNLKNKTNKLFEQLKGLKKKLEKEFEEVSSKHKASCMTELDDIESKIEKGLGLKPIFEQLKQLQNSLRGKKFTRKDRDVVWERMDKSFKVVKEKRFGSQQGTGASAISRHQRRYDGLISAITKMERSISRDKDDLKFQSRKIATTDGQLEMQIRQAKANMIEERVNSKGVKLADMYKTRTELEQKIKKETEKEERRKKIDTATANAEAKIAAEVKKSAEALDKNAESLTQAAAKIAEGKKSLKANKEKSVKQNVKEKSPKEDTLLGAISETVGEAIGGVVDTVVAVSEVVGDKVEKTIDSFVDPKSNEKDTVKKDKSSTKSDTLLGAIVSTVGEALEDVADTVKAASEVVEDKIENAVDSLKGGDNSDSNNGSILDSLVSKVEDVIEDVTDNVKNVTDKIEKEVDKIKTNFNSEEE